MKVIFLEDDRIENVNDGYARNFLFPKKLAIIATEKAIAAAEKRHDKRKAQLDAKKAEFQVVADKLTELPLTIAADAGEGGKLFGAITSTHLAEEVKKQSGIELDRKKITLESPIRAIGEYSAHVRLMHGVETALKVTVVPK